MLSGNCCDTGRGVPTTIADKENVKFSDTGLIPAENLLKEGCTLIGRKIQGTDTKVEDTTKYSELVADYTVTQVTLHAQWLESTYTVKYDTSGGNPEVIADKTNVKLKDSGLLSTDEPTRTGYIMEGNEFKGIVRADGSLVLKVYYKVRHTVSFDSDGGNYKPVDQSVSMETRH